MPSLSCPPSSSPSSRHSVAPSPAQRIYQSALASGPSLPSRQSRKRRRRLPVRCHLSWGGSFGSCKRCSFKASLCHPRALVRPVKGCRRLYDHGCALPYDLSPPRLQVATRFLPKWP